MAAAELITPATEAGNADFTVPPGEIGTLVMFTTGGGTVNQLEERINMRLTRVDPNDNTVPTAYLNNNEIEMTLTSGDYNIAKDATANAVGVYLDGVTEEA